VVRSASYNGACCFYLSWVKQCYVPFRPEILKQEIKVFFVKYNDPIYVKLEKLDIMIRLASQANIAQVSSARSDRSCMCSGHGRNPLVPERMCNYHLCCPAVRHHFPCALCREELEFSP